MAAFEEPHPILAEGQQIEPVVRVQQWQKRLDLKTLVHHNRFLQLQRNPKTVEDAIRHKQSQALTTLFPETRLARQIANRLQELPDFGTPHPLFQKIPLGLGGQILQPQTSCWPSRPAACVGMKMLMQVP
jgi:hypothetical protein